MRDYIIDSDLIKEWNWEKNNELGLYPDQITLGSGRKAWWICSQGHEWDALVCSRSKGQGCPYCSNRKILIGFNDLATTHNELCREWDYSKNIILPTQVSAGSGKKVWWKCSLGHSYLMSVDKRTCANSSCPYCAGKKVLVGFNDLQTANPVLASEWNYVKNGDLKPTMVTGTSGKSVWWIGKCGHEWKAQISNRANGNGCPYCVGFYVLPGLNDLATTRPDLAAEWNYKKNEDLFPTQVSRGYGSKVWWICENGHEWQASPNSRDNMNSGCPACAKGNRISLQETIVYFYVKKYFNDAIQSYHDKNKGITEIDIFIPQLQIGIEYDGGFWHQNVEKDKRKDWICRTHNIKLIRIRDCTCPAYDSSCEFMLLHSKSTTELCDVCKQLLITLGVEHPVINIEQDIQEIEQLRENSLCRAV